MLSANKFVSKKTKVCHRIANDSSMDKSKPFTESRDLFKSRICSDLCGVLLRYLPFEDKVKLMAVDKMFYETIPLNVHSVDFTQSRFRNSRFCTQFTVNAIISTLNLFPTITKIGLPFTASCNSSLDLNNQIVNSLIENCGKLKEIRRLSLKFTDPEIIRKLFVKFGRHLEVILDQSMLLEEQYSLLRNVKSVCFWNYFHHPPSAKIMELRSKLTVRELWVIIRTEFCDFKTAITLMELHENCIQKLRIISTHYFVPLSTVHSFLLKISEMKCLESIIFEFRTPIRIEDFVTDFNRIADSCQMIRFIDICISLDYTISDENLSFFSKMKNILKLKLILFIDYPQSYRLNRNSNLSMKHFDSNKLFRHLKQIKKLDLLIILRIGDQIPFIPFLTNEIFISIVANIESIEMLSIGNIFRSLNGLFTTIISLKNLFFLSLRSEDIPKDFCLKLIKNMKNTHTIIINN